MTKDRDVEALVQLWIDAFREIPVLIDVELMRQVLADAENNQPGGAR